MIPSRRFFLVLMLAVVAACNGQTTTPDLLEDTATTATTQSTTTAVPSTTQPAPTATTATTTPRMFGVLREVLYNESETLDIYVPAGAGPPPVVIILHGGSGNRVVYAPLAETLASEGVMVLNVTWPSDSVSRRGVEGVACAVRFARSVAPDYGGDPDNIIMLGHSAGAAIGSVVALAGDTVIGDCPHAEVSALPNAFIGVAGAYDPTISPGDSRSVYQSTDPELYNLVNPLTHIGGNPELFVVLVHGDKDDVVPAEHSIQFHQTLTDAGYDAALTIVEEASHDSPVVPAADAFAVTVATALDVANR